MKRRYREAGYSIIEMVVAMAVLVVVLAMVLPNWIGRRNQNDLRYGTIQVFSDLREAQEQAKASRAQFTITFTASSASYTIVGATTPTYNKTFTYPGQVRPTADQAVIWSAFGQPDAAHTITLQNSIGTATVSVNATGGITYTLP